MHCAWVCRSQLAPGGVATRVVNKNAGSLTPRGDLGFFASKLAPTEARKTCRSELAPGGVATRVVNENAGSLTPRGDLGLFASKLAPAEITDSVKIVQPRVVRRR
jgi:hypothetical protein